MSSPEDFLYRPDPVTEIPALPARTVVSSLIDRASKGDVMKLVTLTRAASTVIPNTSHQRARAARQSASNGIHLYTIKAAATASAIALVQTKLAPGQSTDGAVFYSLGYEGLSVVLA